MPLDQLRYPGPRPLTEEARLIGRDKELLNLERAALQNLVILITADSGVGKSSFVKAGLIPYFTETENAWIPEVRGWANMLAVLDKADPSYEQAPEMLYRVLLGADPRGTEPLTHVLDALAGDRPRVVVMDQCEEVLRYRPNLAKRLLELAGKLAVKTETRHVVIARSEFREALRPVEAVGSAPWPLLLGELESDTVLKDIIEAPAKDALVTVAPEAAKEIISWWRAARDEADRERDRSRAATPVAPVGLLHLQALLASIESWIRFDERARSFAAADELTTEVLTAFLTARRSDPGPAGASRSQHGDEGAWLVHESLFRYVRAQVAQLDGAMEYQPEGGESRSLRWQNGPRLMLARVAGAMSASGYKQPQSLSMLLPLALGEELSTSKAQQLARDLQRARGPEEFRTRLEQESFGDNDDVAGVAKGWKAAPPAVVEMADSLHAALHQLSQTDVNVLREFTQTDPIYELVHDGLGAALNAWADDFKRGPVATIGVIGPVKFGTIDFSLTSEMFASMDTLELERWGVVDWNDAEGRWRISGLRWHSCVVTPGGDTGAFHDIEFVDCVFRANYFDGGTLDNVVFRDCKFEGTAFEATTLRDTLFSGCELAAPLFRRCVMENVRFKAGERQFGLITIVEPGSNASVFFDDARKVRGIFLEQLPPDSSWHFTNCSVEHMLIESDGAPEVKLIDCQIEGLSLPKVTNEPTIRPDRSSIELLTRYVKA